MTTKLTRREFLQSSAATAGLTIAVAITPSGCKLFTKEEMDAATFTPNIWLRIAADDSVTVIVNKSEMGQGVYTSIPMLVADELDADWKTVRILPAPAAAAYNDPVWGMQVTGGSTTIRHMYEPLRKAGAAAREMLITAASRIWKVEAAECDALEGVVRHAKSGRSLRYGQLVRTAQKVPIPLEPKTKEKSGFKIIGESLPRLDVVDKVNGTAQFGIDVFVPDMLYAAIARPPAYGAKPLSFDRDAALKIDGVKHVVAIKSGIAVCGLSLEAATRGREALDTKWDQGGHPTLDNVSLNKRLIGSLHMKGKTAAKRGNTVNALERAKILRQATYRLPYLAHATMEPMNCTARINKDGCDVWIPTQNQSGVLGLAAAISGLSPEKIRVHTTYLGGGFGRRFELDVAEEALMLAGETGSPIKIIWSREEDMAHDFYRPAAASSIIAGMNKAGNIRGWRHTIVCPSVFARVFPEQVQDGIDHAAVEGVADTIYDIPNFKVDYVRFDTPVPVGFWRSVGHSHNAFIMEGFIDEMAHAAGKDPLAFRLQHLKKQPRARKVLETVADKGGWASPPPKGRGRGLAVHFSFDSYVAQMAEVSVDEKGVITVHRVVCAVDCGKVVNPAIIKAQMRGGIVFGLSAALKEEVAVANGGIRPVNFDEYEILRLAEAPQVEVHIIESGGKLGGIGEPGVPPIAPAVANAVFAATGVRLRQLPMRPATVLEAMPQA